MIGTLLNSNIIIVIKTSLIYIGIPILCLYKENETGYNL